MVILCPGINFKILSLGCLRKSKSRKVREMGGDKMPILKIAKEMEWRQIESRSQGIESSERVIHKQVLELLSFSRGRIQYPLKMVQVYDSYQ